ncbi:hypothetical protein GGF32_005870 [Allomyces javanicus]|nr:hypothetical protein GGF32_005870 [Allomyces javanicus]
MNPPKLPTTAPCTVMRDFEKEQGIKLRPGMKLARKWAKKQADARAKAKQMPSQIPRDGLPSKVAPMYDADEGPDEIKKAVDADFQELVETMNMADVPRAGMLALKDVTERWYTSPFVSPLHNRIRIAVEVHGIPVAASLPHVAIFLSWPLAPVAVERVLGEYPLFRAYYYRRLYGKAVIEYFGVSVTQHVMFDDVHGITWHDTDAEDAIQLGLNVRATKVRDLGRCSSDDEEEDEQDEEEEDGEEEDGEDDDVHE